MGPDPRGLSHLVCMVSRTCEPIRSGDTTLPFVKVVLIDGLSLACRVSVCEWGGGGGSEVVTSCRDGEGEGAAATCRRLPPFAPGVRRDKYENSGGREREERGAGGEHVFVSSPHGLSALPFWVEETERPRRQPEKPFIWYR